MFHSFCWFSLVFVAERVLKCGMFVKQVIICLFFGQYGFLSLNGAVGPVGVLCFWKNSFCGNSDFQMVWTVGERG